MSWGRFAFRESGPNGIPVLVRLLALDVKDPTDALYQRQPTVVHAVFYVHLFHMRYPTLGLFAALSLKALAQPPIQLEWSALLPYGTGPWLPLPRISVHQDTTAWMVHDNNDTWTTSDGIVRSYLEDGTPITGYMPYYRLNCGHLDYAIDFTLRNDSMWGVSLHENLGNSDRLYCANTPAGDHEPNNELNGLDLPDGAYALHVSSSRWFISAWHQVSTTERLSRIVALDFSNNVLWETDLPMVTPGYPDTQGPSRTLVERGDSLGVAAFPELIWLDADTGEPLGSTTLYTGDLGVGAVLWNGEAFLWAAHADGLLHYGKLNGLAEPLWSSSIAGSTVNGIAEDVQGRLWIGGTAGVNGMLTRISPAGAVEGSWPQYASVTDVVFHNDRLFWTGSLMINEIDSYLMVGTPNP